MNQEDSNATKDIRDAEEQRNVNNELTDDEFADLRTLTTAIAFPFCSNKSVAIMNSELEKLLSTANDFDLCNRIFVLICARDEDQHVVVTEKYTVEERTVVLVWHTSGIVDNGGFEYLFSGDFPGDPDFRLTVQAFETIGCERAVTAFRDALSLFANGQPPEDIESRYEAYIRAPKTRRNEINQRFWSVGWDNDQERKLADYIRAHRHSFDQLE